MRDTMEKLPRLKAEMPARETEILDYEMNIERFDRMLKKYEALPFQIRWSIRRHIKNLRKRLQAERANHAFSILTRDTIAELIEEQS